MQNNLIQLRLGLTLLKTLDSLFACENKDELKKQLRCSCSSVVTLGLINVNLP